MAANTTRALEKVRLGLCSLGMVLFPIGKSSSSDGEQAVRSDRLLTNTSNIFIHKLLTHILIQITSNIIYYFYYYYTKEDYLCDLMPTEAKCFCNKKSPATIGSCLATSSGSRNKAVTIASRLIL